MQITEHIIEQGKSKSGGWSRKQLELLDVQWDINHHSPFKGWKQTLVGRDVDEDKIEVFISLKDKHLKKKANTNLKAKKDVSRSCEIPDCQGVAERKYFGKWRCKSCWRQRKHIASTAHRKAKRTLKAKKKAGKKKLTETERRKRIFASWKNPELDKLRRTPEYQEWRVAVLERDEYKCQHCEKTGGRLHAHHLKTFKMHPDLRYDVDNGVTLCNKCHEDLHIANVDHKTFIIKLRAG
jgi:hypothetical protein